MGAFSSLDGYLGGTWVVLRVSACCLLVGSACWVLAGSMPLGIVTSIPPQNSWNSGFFKPAFSKPSVIFSMPRPQDSIKPAL